MARLHRFYLPEISADDSFSITDKELVHQLHTVLRYTVGDECIIFTPGSDDYIVTIDSIDKHTVSVRKGEPVPARTKPSREVIAALSITKRDTFELMVQKLTELGVTTIVPIISDRTIKQDVRLDRLVLISKEAVEQSGRNTLVDIMEPLSLGECLAQLPYPSIVFDTTTEAQGEIPDGRIVMYIGPEGGWSEADKILFEKHGVEAQSLGTLVLRSETAAIVGAYKLLWQ